MEQVEVEERSIARRDEKKNRVVTVVVTHKWHIPKDDDGSIYQGTTTYSKGVVSNHSFIPATQHHIHSLFDLKELSSCHEFLLSIFSEFEFQSKTLLVTSPVYTIPQYFSITSNIFVTKDGRARVLPSYDNSLTTSKDIDQLIQLMKKVLNLPFQDEDETEFRAQDFGLPHQLIHFISHVPDFIGRVPTFYLLNHPYFWEIEQSVHYVFKMEMVMSPYQEFHQALSHTLSEDKLFQDWAHRLFDDYVDDIHFKQGVDEIYREIWFNTGDGGKQDLDLQKDPVKRVLSKVDVAEGLHKYYPQFYTTIFKGICTCVKEKRILDVVRILKQISFRYYGHEVECEFLYTCEGFDA